MHILSAAMLRYVIRDQGAVGSLGNDVIEISGAQRDGRGSLTPPLIQEEAVLSGRARPVTPAAMKGCC